MKSYFLHGIPATSENDIAVALDAILPGQQRPWILCDRHDDTIAYFDFSTEGTQRSLQADISGRHYFEDAAVIDILKALRARVGGIVTDDGDYEVG